MTPTETVSRLRRLANDWRKEEKQLCEQFGGEIIPHSMRARRIKDTKALEAAVELIDRLEAAEKEREIDEQRIADLMVDLNRVGHENEELRAKITEMERQELGFRERCAPSPPTGYSNRFPLYALPGAKGE